MLEVASAIIYELGGKLCNEEKKPLNTDALENYVNDITSQTEKHSMVKNTIE